MSKQPDKPAPPSNDPFDAALAQLSAFLDTLENQREQERKRHKSTSDIPRFVSYPCPR